MAYPTAVNNETTDSVTQSNVKVLSEASAMAMGTLYQTSSSSLSMSIQNSVANQQQNSIVASTATSISIEKILGNK